MPRTSIARCVPFPLLNGNNGWPAVILVVVAILGGCTLHYPLRYESDNLIAVITRAAASLNRLENAHPLHEIPNFLSPTAVSRIRADVMQFIADSRGQEWVAPERDAEVRHSEAVPFLQRLSECEVKGQSLPESLKQLRRLVYRLHRTLREVWAREHEMIINNILEVTLLRYPEGGYYRRHVDSSALRSGELDHVSSPRDGNPLTARGSHRVLSMVLFLTPDDWLAQDGGALRIFNLTCAQSAGCTEDEKVHRDIIPTPGTLVLFDSQIIEHSVQLTTRERLVMGGHFSSPALPGESE